MIDKGQYNTLFLVCLNYFYSVFRPFQDHFSSFETGQSVGGAKTGEPPENLQAELGLSHTDVTRAGLEPTPDTAVRCLYLCLTSQSRAMFMSRRCLHFMGRLYKITMSWHPKNVL